LKAGYKILEKLEKHKLQIRNPIVKQLCTQNGWSPITKCSNCPLWSNLTPFLMYVRRQISC